MSSTPISSVTENVIVASALIIGGLAYCLRALDYGLGTGAEPAAGYFPAVLGLTLSALSSIVLIRTILVARRSAQPAEGNGPWPLRSMACVLVATVSFGLLLGGLPAYGIDGLGLVPSAAISVFIAGFASRVLTLKQNLLLSGLLALGAGAIFIAAMGLIIPAWPWSY